MRRVLRSTGTVVLVGGPRSKRVLRPLGHIARVNGDDLRSLSELVEAGQVSPLIEHRYALVELGGAMRRMGHGHVRGKRVVTVT